MIIESPADMKLNGMRENLLAAFISIQLVQEIIRL
jgi:hypothetical protein